MAKLKLAHESGKSSSQKSTHRQSLVFLVWMCAVRVNNTDCLSYCMHHELVLVMLTFSPENGAINVSFLFLATNTLGNYNWRFTLAKLEYVAQFFAHRLNFLLKQYDQWKWEVNINTQKIINGCLYVIYLVELGVKGCEVFNDET